MISLNDLSDYEINDEFSLSEMIALKQKLENSIESRLAEKLKFVSDRIKALITSLELEDESLQLVFKVDDITIPVKPYMFDIIVKEDKI